MNYDLILNFFFLALALAATVPLGLTSNLKFRGQLWVITISFSRYSFERSLFHFSCGRVSDKWRNSHSEMRRSTRERISLHPPMSFHHTGRIIGRNLLELVSLQKLTLMTQGKRSEGE